MSRWQEPEPDLDAIVRASTPQMIGAILMGTGAGRRPPWWPPPEPPAENHQAHILWVRQSRACWSLRMRLVAALGKEDVR